MEEYKILESGSPNGLTTKVNEHIADGWERIGSHQVAVKHISVERAMTQHRYQLEYSQTVKR